MSKFKAGDRVRCVDAAASARQLRHMAEYTVRAVEIDRIYLHEVDFLSGWWKSRFQLISPAPVQPSARPRAGQWWFDNDTPEDGSADKYGRYCVGLTTEGLPVFQISPNGMVSIWSTPEQLHHEPDCTGWDWVKPAAAKQEDAPVEPPTNQQLFEMIQDVRDMIAKLAAGVDPKLTESPDDWVTQDLVPARPGVDQVRWSDWPEGHWKPMTAMLLLFHGEKDFEHTLSVRCRRKDLPKAVDTTGTAR